MWSVRGIHAWLILSTWFVLVRSIWFLKIWAILIRSSMQRSCRNFHRFRWRNSISNKFLTWNGRGLERSTLNHFTFYFSKCALVKSVDLLQLCWNSLCKLRDIPSSKFPFMSILLSGFVVMLLVNRLKVDIKVGWRLWMNKAEGARTKFGTADRA